MPSEPTPKFESNIPGHLLENTSVSPQDRWVMEQISILGQKNDWQSSEILEIKKDLSEVKVETKKTNGRVTKSEAEIEDSKDTIRKAKFTFDLIANKWFWTGAAVFFLFILPILTNNITFKQFVGFFIG